MILPLWPAELPQTPERRSWAGGPREDRSAFQPDVGPPILRGRTTADTCEYSGTFPLLTYTQIEIWREFWRVDLRRGVLPFRWIDPVFLDEGRWIVGAASDKPYMITSRGGRRFDLALSLIRLPGGAA